jgi:hypothetical protein
MLLYKAALRRDVVPSNAVFVASGDCITHVTMVQLLHLKVTAWHASCCLGLRA